MRTLAYLSSLATFFVVAAQALIPATPPQFETLFVGALELGDVGTISNSTFGTRVYAPISGGNFTDPSGKLVATVLPGSADTGIANAAGFFFPQVVLNLRWEVDQKLAYLRAEGVGKLFESDLNYLHLETDSETYSALNSRFLLVNVSFTEGDPTHSVVTIFGAV
ncbi:hypothetical protein K466DRAFT_581242 [Polyporus arcularius HHB13444]|uniref:Uncharacterized protein n=1 Tax=Polyporus arcularius HHB13444 TaxID=1314778 RepID=A0A5C3PTP4_9APHY|nr:hypothetical protein K466DRAFT_581242 [Polyporus arcularius HHB13444]